MFVELQSGLSPRWKKQAADNLLEILLWLLQRLSMTFCESPPSRWLLTITTRSYEHKSQPSWGTSHSIVCWVNLFLRVWYHQQDAWWHTERLILLLESSVYLFSLSNAIRNRLGEISCWDFKFSAVSWSAWEEQPRLSSHFSSQYLRQLRLFTEVW